MANGLLAIEKPDELPSDLRTRLETMEPHDVLKHIAVMRLTEEGFDLREIKTEQVVTLPFGQEFRVDVVGISKKKKVAVECGETEVRKVALLLLEFDMVYHLPYPKQKPIQMTWKEAKKIIESYLENYEYSAKHVIKVADAIRRWLESL